MKVLIIDNYDSFTFNLYQYVGEILSRRMGSDFQVLVKRNDAIALAEAQAMKPDRIIISPGPGTPKDPAYFGVCRDIILEMGPSVPLLGVCLGMQGIAYCFGGDISLAKVPMHGKISNIVHDGKTIFTDIPESIEVMRYHSLITSPNSLPDCLEIIALIEEPHITGDELSAHQVTGGEIMGIRHKVHPIHGIQFHPESFATEGGMEILANFLL